MSRSKRNAWPDLSKLDLGPTLATLHLWSQVAGKIRLALTPWINQSWQVTLYLSARGLTTGLIPLGDRAFEFEFDLLDDRAVIRDTDGNAETVELVPRSVASFYKEVFAALERLGIEVRIDAMPCEIEGAVPFHKDKTERAYDGDAARTYWRALLQAQRVMQVFRTRFRGKCSPVHLFWGAFDLAVTRFSGRSAPPHPGGAINMPDEVAREAYCQEVSSAGFWPGGGPVAGPAFYSYAYAAPEGFGQYEVSPKAAYFDTTLGEFLLPYDAVQSADDPDGALLSFLQTTYEAAANLAQWDREQLEGPTGPIGHPP